ncbi:MAG: hypothetical protein ACR2LG_05475 [Actinomycetota bacterium]
MGRQFKVLLIGAAFTVVAMGFAYAVPRAMHSAANEPPRNSIVLLTGGNESPSGSPEGSGDACDEPTASDEPCDDDDGTDGAEDPDGGDDQGEDTEGGAGSATNHGSAVRVAAHCPVRGRAHGKLVRSIAHDKEATVASAEQACADAMAEDAQDGSKAKSGKSKKTKKVHSSGHDAEPSGSNSPKAPKAHAPKAPAKASSTAGSGSAAPGHSAGHGKPKGKSK